MIFKQFWHEMCYKGHETYQLFTKAALALTIH